MPSQNVYTSYPLVDESGAYNSIVVVDIICHQKHCFYRTEGLWQQWAQKRSIGKTCGFSGCLLNSCCLLNVKNQSSCYPEHKRRRYVLDVTSVV
jgi:hypothetical protein